MTSEEILFDAEERMEKAAEVFKNDLAGIRTGRANPAWSIRCASKSTARPSS